MSDVRVAIDLNVRLVGGRTYAGLEDVTGGEVQPGMAVEVFEEESQLSGNAWVTDVDRERGLIYLRVDWASVAETRAAPATTSWRDLPWGVHVERNREVVRGRDVKAAVPS